MSTVRETGGPRTRLTDPISSHVAGDRSGETREAVADAVVRMLMDNGPMSGADLNKEYAIAQLVYGWPVAAYDSPRKRAGELAREGFIVVLNPDDPRGTPHIYAMREVA